ncbi:MAG: hypothetical protein DMG51_04425 [Acidobacteria bacterium]|nr:MAG: hypothetical protein DMG51_04425 [Acidobacteriota bacterium]
MKMTLLEVRGTPLSLIWIMTWTTRMTPNTDATAAPQTPCQKPRLALAIATALGVGYIPKVPGTFGSLVGIAVAILTHPVSLTGASSDSIFGSPRNCGLPGSVE